MQRSGASSPVAWVIRLLLIVLLLPLVPVTTAIFASPITFTLTLSKLGNGAVTISPPGPTYPAGTVVTLTTQSTGDLFTGWTIDNTASGWATTYNLTMDTNHTVRAMFAPRPAFSDLPVTNPYYEAITQLAARGIIKGYGDGRVGVSDTLIRAQIAALIVRSFGWGNTPLTAGTNFADISQFNDELQRAILILAQKGVVKGYGNGNFGPGDNVLHIQVISLVVRSMVEAGLWQQVTQDDPAIYPNMTNASHRLDLLTYVKYIGDVYGQPRNQNWSGWYTPASRGWAVQLLWQGLNGTLSVPPTPGTSPSPSPSPSTSPSPSPSNHAPVAQADTYGTNQNAALTIAAPGVLSNDTDADNNPLTAILDSSPSHGTLTFNANGSFTYTPQTAYVGSDSFTYHVSDGLLSSSPVTVTIAIGPVNQPPSFTKGADQTVQEGAGGQTVANWATNISPGPANESSQSVTFLVTQNTNPGLFATGPAISPTGTLTYTPAANTSGTATVTIKLQDDGGTANGGVNTSATQSFTITVSHTNVAPQVVSNPKEAFDTIGNVPLELAASHGTGLSTFVSGNLLSNFNDTDGPNTLQIGGIAGCTATSAPFVCASTHGGSVTMQANGTFLFTPKAGDSNPTDTFQYIVTDGADTVTRTVTITLKGRIWFVQNTAAAGGTGTASAPFNTLAAAATAAQPNDYIFVYGGDLTTTGQAAGIALQSGQKLYGQAYGLTVDVGTLNGVAAPTTLLPADTTKRPAISHAGASTISAANAANVEVRGFTITGGTNAIDLATSGGASGTIAVTDNQITSAGTNGIVLNDTSSALSVVLSNNTITATGIGMSITGPVAGTTTITTFASNQVSNTGGNGIAITNATFDATPGGAFTTVAGGTTTVGSTATPVGGTAMILTNVRGDLAFTTLDLTGSTAGLKATGNGTFNATGGTGFQLAVASGAGTIQASGPVVDLATVTVNLPGVVLHSTNSATTGLALNTVAGTLTAASTSTITNATGTDFSVSNSSAAISYAGSITDTTGNGAGVALSSNTGAISFSGSLVLNTGTGAAFSATGGGTVSATATGSSLTTTTGAALTVTNTTIGSGGLSFTAISASGATQPITLNNTGTLGGLSVTGTGTVNSGGTITNASTAVSLTNTANVTLKGLHLTSAQHFAIQGQNVHNFSGDLLTIDGTNGTTTGTRDGAVRFNELTGTAALTNSTLGGALVDTFALYNSQGSLTLTINTVTFGANDTTNGDNGLLIEASTSANIQATISNSQFTGARGDLLDTSLTNNATGTLGLTLSGNTFANSHPNIVANGGGVILSGTGGTFNYTIDTNTFQGALGPALGISCGNATAICTGTIKNNTLGVASVTNSGSATNGGIALISAGGGSFTTLVNNNKIYQYNNHGILLQAGELQGHSLAFNATITNNTISNPGTTYSNFNGIHLNAGTVSTDNFTACVKLTGNTLTGAGVGATAPNNVDLRLRQRQQTTVVLPGYTGGNNDNNAIMSYLAGQNTLGTSAASNTAPTGGGYTNGTCTQP